MSETTRLVTAEELEKLPEDEFKYELIAGRLIRMSPVGYLHGKIALQFAALLVRYLEGRDLGTAVIEVTAEQHTGCRQFSDRFGVDATRFVNSPEGKQRRLRGLNAKVVQAGTVRVGDLAIKQASAR